MDRQWTNPKGGNGHPIELRNRALGSSGFLWQGRDNANLHRIQGQPDQDFVFMIGVLLCILLINTVLLALSILALCVRRFRNSSEKQVFS
jgi:hypothetical protein